MDGSTFVAVNDAIYAALNDRAGLAGVSILYQPPENATETANDAGDRDSIWLDVPDTDGTMVEPFMKAAPDQYDEEYDLLIVVQSYRKESDATQRTVDVRANEMLGDIVGMFESNPNLVDISNAFPLCVISLAGRRFAARGRLPNAPGHGTRIEVTVHVHARLALS